MDKETAQCVALMSIKPEFAFRLLSGEKQVEFRRRAASRNITHIVVYATRPVGAVVGVLEIDGLTQATPRELWKAYAEVGGIGKDDFFDYFSGTQEGVAYRVKKAWSCVKARKLGKAGLPAVPPQAVQYLPSKTMERLGPLESAVGLQFESWMSQVGGS